MSLEEEIAIYQFAQGVHSDRALLDSFRQLNDDERYYRLFDLFRLVGELKAIPSDVEQAIIEGSFDPNYTPCISVSATSRVSKFRSLYVPEGDLIQDYTFLLYLIKTAYQRRFDIDKGNPTKWWYQDLSDREVVQGILTRYEALVEELYNSPSYRSEFSCIAKLWHEHNLLTQASQQEPDSEDAKKYHFITYDEMVEQGVPQLRGLFKYTRPMGLLRQSLEKGLAIRYQLDRSLLSKIVSAVIDRHLRETYNTGLF